MPEDEEFGKIVHDIYKNHYETKVAPEIQAFRRKYPVDCLVKLDDEVLRVGFYREGRLMLFRPGNYEVVREYSMTEPGLEIVFLPDTVQ